MRNTGSKYLRNFSQTNKRLQDGPKRYLLSPKAEQEFSLKEKWFVENIFKHYLQEKKFELGSDSRNDSAEILQSSSVFAPQFIKKI